MQNKTIYILDTREKPNYRWSFSEYLAEDETTEIKKVDTGDYTIAGLENYISIDRKKSVDELVNDFFSDKDRFKRELERAKEIEHFFIVCEFGYNELFKGSRYSKVSPAFLLSVINEVEFHYKNIAFIMAGSAKNAEFLSYRILKTAQRLVGGKKRWI